jgi:hypothetical protein
MKNCPIPLLLAGILILFSGCEKDRPTPDAGPDYTIPDTYNFENVNYSGQLQRLAMLQEMKTYMRSANTAGTLLDRDRLAAMYSNDAAGAQWQRSYEASKQLRNKTFENEQDRFISLIGELASASESADPAAEGQAGVAVSQNGEKQYLLAANGLEYAQIIEKGIMGATFYYQATSVYLGPDKMNVDNETVEPGEGTQMEHHWDEAFGYLGVPRDFPVSTDGIIFWGHYCNGRDALLGTNQRIMEALLKGRAAISNDDPDTRDEAIAEVRAVWEEVAAGTALHYLNQAIDNFDDFAVRAHTLSEAVAFIYSLQFNAAKRISNQEAGDLLTMIGGDAAFTKMNLYQTDQTELIQARDQLAALFDLESMKEQF